jgi:prevent-host-death family protein
MSSRSPNSALLASSRSKAARPARQADRSKRQGMTCCARRLLMARRMSAKEARDRFGEVLNRAYYQREPIIVERQGKPVAVVVSPADW